MRKQELEQLSAVIQHNCHIADSRHAADYSMCIYLLKMREFYRWENGLSFADKLSHEQVGAWLEQREEFWQGLQEQPFGRIPLGQDFIEPFEAEVANEILVPKGLVYSAGFGRNGRPHFFLGRLLSVDRYGEYQVLVTGDELARDLVAPPAMLLGDTIYIRRESLRRMVWEKIESWNWNRPANAMARALSFYDMQSDLERALEEITDNETEAVILHEIGERIAGQLLGEEWADMLLGLTGTQAEVMARAVRDHLADCVSTWPALIEDRNEASLHFFFANFSAMRKKLFPGAMSVYEQWVRDGNLQSMRSLVVRARKHWLEIAGRMLDIYSANGPAEAGHIQAMLETEAIL